MSDIFGVFSVGTHGHVVRLPPSQKPAQVAPPAESGASQTSPDHRQSDPLNILMRANQKAQEDIQRNPDAPTGPPPAFQASLLDIDYDLQTALRRAAAARELTGNGMLHASTVQPPPPLDAELAARAAKGLAPPATPADLLGENAGKGR